MPVEYRCTNCSQAADPIVYEGPLIIGTPWIWWEGGYAGGNRYAWFRLEGVPAGTHTFRVYFHPSFSGDPGSNDVNSDQSSFAVQQPAGYASNIWFYGPLTRPWYGEGEIAPTGLTLYMDDPPGSTGGTLVAPGTVNIVYSLTGGPPLGYQGFV